RFDTINMFHAYQSGARFAAGYSGTPPTYYITNLWILESFNMGRPTQKAFEYIKKHGITHFLLDTNNAELFAFENPQAYYDSAPYLTKLLCAQSYCLYQIKHDE